MSTYPKPSKKTGDKEPSCFIDTTQLVRWIDPDWIRAKHPRISSVAFERSPDKKNKTKKEEYLSVQSLDLESLTDILSYYADTKSKDTKDILYAVQNIKKINKKTNSIQNNFIIRDKEKKCFCYASIPAYAHKPTDMSPSHSGMMFLQGLTELDEKKLAMELTKDLKHITFTKPAAKKSQKK